MTDENSLTKKFLSTEEGFHSQMDIIYVMDESRLITKILFSHHRKMVFTMNHLHMLAEILLQIKLLRTVTT